MTTRALRIALCLWTALLAVLAGAQMPSPATWSSTVQPAKAAPGARVELVLRAEVPKPWHLYSMNPVADGPFPTKIVVEPGGAIAEVGKPVQGPPLKKLDKNFGKEVEYYEGSAEFRVPIRLAKTASGATKVEAAVRFQLCNEGTCLPPTSEDHPVRVSGTVDVSGAPVVDTTPLDAPPVASVAPRTDVDVARSKGLLAYLLLAVGFGFASLLTPCVFPMIPITVSFFSKQKAGESALKKALAYCAGIVGTFTALGVVVALVFGATGLTTLANNPWLNLGLAVVFVLLAFSLFGFFEIGVPSSVLNRLDGSGKAGLLGPVLMGLTFSLTSFTCTLPFVGAVLVSASQGDVLWPAVGMLAFSSAFCLPFFLLALFPAALSKLPRSGAWLATVKAFMGFVELAAAVKFVSSVDLGIVSGGLGIVTREVFLAVWFGIALLAAMFLLGVVRLPHVHEGRFGPFRYAFGAATLAGAGYLLLALNGRSLGSLEGFLPPSPYPGRGDAKEASGLVWIADYDQAVAKANGEGKPLFIDFTGVYCTNCRDMERNMFPRPAISERLKGYVLARLYTDRDRPDDKRNQTLLQKLTNTVTLPSYVADAEGRPQVGAFTRDESAFTEFLDRGLGKALSAKR